jgi:anthranilate phosphoribosyltransferase
MESGEPGEAEPPMSFLDAIHAAGTDPSDRPFSAKLLDELRRRDTNPGPRADFVNACTDVLSRSEILPDEDAEGLFREILHGSISELQIGTLLVVLRPEILPARTIAAFARVMRDASPLVEPELPPEEILGDTCGTGGDTVGTFNVSTTITFVLAAAGIRIAKHGNRAVTSRCGSADVLEALDVVIDLQADQVKECIERVGIGFMFAPVFHEGLRNVQQIRRVLATEMPTILQRRSVFNVLGPLANPARAGRQIIGVYEETLVPKIAEVLAHLKVERAIVAHGRCDGSPIGLDEFSTAGPTHFAELRDGKITEHWITPEDVGLRRVGNAAGYAGGDARMNARILTDLLMGSESDARADLMLMNAGAGLYLGDKAKNIAEGVEQARDLIRGGRASEKFEAFRAMTHAVRR